MCACEFRIQINNNNNLTYKAAPSNNEFFNQISNAPYIHAIFKHQRSRPGIVFVAYTRQYKDAIHDQDYEEHHLDEEKCLFWGVFHENTANFMFLLCNRNFKLLTHIYDNVYLLLHGFYFKLCQNIFFIPKFSINMHEVLVDKLFLKKLI